MQKPFILLCICAFVVFFFSLRCEAKKEIVGGQLATQGQLPFLVSVNLPSPFGEEVGSCTGSVYSAEWVITAAHCFEDAFPSIFNKTSVLAGGVTNYNTSVFMDPNGQFRNGTAYPNPDWDPITMFNDIALIHVSPPFDLTGITTVKIADKNFDDDAAKTAFVAGYGVLESNEMTILNCTLRAWIKSATTSAMVSSITH